MADLVPLFLHVKDRYTVQRSPIGGLTSPFGLEGRSVQDHRPAFSFGFLLQKAGFEVRKARICVV